MALCLPVIDVTVNFATVYLSMRIGLLYIAVLMLFSSCTGLKNVFQPAPSSKPVAAQSKSPFIEDIVIRPDDKPVETKKSYTNSPLFTIKKAGVATSPFEQFTINQFKYAIQLDVTVETLTNTSLYNFIDEWWQAPYRLGGTTKKGIDCSAFVQTLMLGAFAIQLPRTVREQKAMSAKIAAEELHEGDLVFFNTRRGVSHVGVYLHNNKFVHASTSGGVMISDLNEEYWRRKFLGAGRIIQHILPKP